MLRCVRELRLSHRFLSLWNVRRWRLSPHKPRNLVRILKSLPLRPAHLSHTSPSAIYFTGTGEGGCVTLLADGSALFV
ncbi:hypothetical protein CE91St62_05170 [Lachnospiraceae bacterium]|nr:hypothetical protein CE91St61_05210 [Lachnospiraceae bacterium]BDF36456.1 hypothetical protein CE91St62_05170 [Lachnospiraceae bacterium]